MSGRFVRLGETGRRTVTLVVDDRPVHALEGDSVLIALLTSGLYVRSSEFGDGRRAGFCVMGACQDCWVWTADGHRIRACSTPVAEGMRLATCQPDATWANLA